MSAAHHQVSPATDTDHLRSPVLREARPADVATIARFVRDVAIEEDFPGAVSSTADDLHQILFGADAFARALVVDIAGTLVGFALSYPTYSTVSGRRGLHLEDLFISEGHRREGLGERLIRHLAAEAHRGGGRLEWWVLHTNTAAHRFYRRLGAREVEEVGVRRLDPAPDLDHNL